VRSPPRLWRAVTDRTTAYVTGGIYREIVPDEKLVFVWVRPAAGPSSTLTGSTTARS
jgi:uncharacterized protein YndB with AHSA1/START domain